MQQWLPSGTFYRHHEHTVFTFHIPKGHVDIDIRDSPHTKWVDWSQFPELIDTVTVPPSTVAVSYNHNSSCSAMSLTAWRRGQCQGCPPASILSPRCDLSHSPDDWNCRPPPLFFYSHFPCCWRNLVEERVCVIKLGVSGSINLIIITDFDCPFFRLWFMLLIY